ncbi:PQQ-binding-like beta-propeller repeat protein [Luteolibacter arcticus]|uniref:PQQ-binding-like beta-propeller repeat protein n=1 Tax=Luteolibacter arcticus TaxID=1581411 RepID=A0ABT3GGA9_9BACT|nr:PQQ-binding-like beta-propeller repeat protein [Luteolibacter arcticus]MCW1922649.1 PQQ-binding-like beta-propeller repeat protein [Luteolibacter arcticus]
MILTLGGLATAHAAGWPMQRHDAGRSGATDEPVEAARLAESWTLTMAVPRTAWPKSARWDAFNLISNMLSARIWDACYQACSDGQRLYIASSTEDAVIAVDLTTGKELWRFTCGGPVRIAPSLVGDRLLFGSDDGFAYCLSAAEGKLVWSMNPSPGSRRVIHNERVISPAPVRTGIVVREGTAYFGCGLTTLDKGWICAVDAATGKADGRGRYVREMPGQTIEGPLTLTQSLLIVPRGRLAPLSLDRETGSTHSQMAGSGGPFCVVIEDGQQLRSNDAREGEAALYKSTGEKMTSVGKGSAIAVRGERAYIVVDGHSVQSIDRKTGAMAWSREVPGAGEVIVAADTVLVGGEGVVMAFSCDEGKELWKGKVAGRALGLVAAGGHLIASTDLGHLHAFAPTAPVAAPIAGANDAAHEQTPPPMPKVPVFSSNSLMLRYVFHRTAMAGSDGKPLTGGTKAGVKIIDTCQRTPAVLTSSAAMVAMRGSGEAIVLDGSSYYTATDLGVKKMPSEEISVEAFARINRAQSWGAVIGCLCDDGSDERGWILGVRGPSFAFGLGTAGSKIDYATAPAELFNDGWHHLVGTYDGKMMRLYLDGREVAAMAKTGPITYPDETPVILGAYKDKDECFPVQGSLHEARVWRRCLSPGEISKSYSSKAELFLNGKAANALPPVPRYDEITVGPFTRFLGAGKAEVTWATASAMPNEVRVNGSSGSRVWGEGSGTGHRVVIEGLEWGRVYGIELGGLKDRPFELDTAQDRAYVPPVATTTNTLVAAAVKGSPNGRGMAAVIGAEQMEAAVALAAAGYRTVMIEPDATKASLARATLGSSMLLGDHVAVIAAADLKDATLPTAFAAIVISPAMDATLARRFARPYGGAVWTPGVEDKPVFVRTAPEGSASWTSQYGDAASAHYAGETLRNAAGGDDLTPQWLGEPGPRFQTDRQNRKSSPLAANGRLFLQGFQRLLALDAYSGAVLWGVETPGVARFNVPHGGSNWCCDGEAVYLAHGPVLDVFDGGTGVLSNFLSNPVPELEWGQVMRTRTNPTPQGREILLGSSVRAGAEFTTWWGRGNWYDGTQGDSVKLVMADALFAHDVPLKRNAAPRWLYRGLVVQPSVCSAEGKVFFLERKFSKDPADRKLTLDETGQTSLVALDLESGREVWRNPVEVKGPATAAYVISSRGKVVLELALRNGTFEVSTFDAANGKPLWAAPPVKWEADHHGKHISRIGTQGELLYLRPRIFNLESGEVVKTGFPAGHTCGSYSLASNFMVGRMGELILWNAKQATETRLSRFRQDCWIGAIPACGMLLVPETGGGCSCGGWMETSLGLIPKITAADFP